MKSTRAKSSQEILRSHLRRLIKDNMRATQTEIVNKGDNELVNSTDERIVSELWSYFVGRNYDRVYREVLDQWKRSSSEVV